MKFLLGLFAMLTVSTVAQAQFTETPVKTECSKKCSGVVTLRNDGLAPFTFTVDAVTTHFSPAGPSYERLDEGTEVQLSVSSGRLGPKDAVEVAYKIRCKTTPCVVTLISAAMPPRVNGSVATRMALPFTVYSCDKQKDCRMQTLNAAGTVPPELRK